MGWLWGIVEDARNAESIRDWVAFALEHQFFIAGLVVLAMFAQLAWVKRGNLGIRPKMHEIEAGMESGWASKREVKRTGLYE